jgi:hypothetical protein
LISWSIQYSSKSSGTLSEESYFFKAIAVLVSVGAGFKPAPTSQTHNFIRNQNRLITALMQCFQAAISEPAGPGKGPIAVHDAEPAHYEKAISNIGIYPLISQKYREKHGMRLFLNSRLSNWVKNFSRTSAIEK